MKPKTIYKALLAIDNTFKFEVKSNNEIIWQDNRPQPTKKQIEAKIKELEAKAVIDKKFADATSFIYKHYPQTKQNSDLADKLYYENLLKAQGVQNLEADIVARVQNFYDGKSLEEVLADVDAEHKEAYEQLTKVGIRVAWVQQCKAELKAAISEDREPNFPQYPL